MTRPNILLIMTDEHRGDALGIHPDSCVDTPYLDEIASQGTLFNRAYSACPICVPARRTLMSGQKPGSHGVVMNFHAELKGKTLPQALGEVGYQTHLSGKLHLYPLRKLYGFGSTDWADGPYQFGPESDYNRFLMENGFFLDAGLAHGMSFNGWPARPFHLDEKFHFTNWCTDRALRFLERRDPTAPFFLKVGYHQPHAPCTPPAYYFDKYMKRDLPGWGRGDWEGDLPNTQKGLPVNAWRVDGNAKKLKEYKAGYYGCIEHVDHQIGRLLYHLPPNTVVLFTSDHGEMLGEHGWIRKRSAYEGSARIPFILRLPAALAEERGLSQGTVCNTAVELMDVMPTILDLAGVSVPDSVDGLSLLPLLRGASLDREYIHGECAKLETIGSGMQYLTDGIEKYIWYPALAKEQLFNLCDDPGELNDLVKAGGREESLVRWRQRMIKELAGRPEGLTDGKSLLKLEGPTAYCISDEILQTGKIMDQLAAKLF